MKPFKNKYFLLAFSVLIITIVFLFFFLRKEPHKPLVIDKPAEKEKKVPALLSPGPTKEKEKAAKKIILNLDDLDVIKNAEQQPQKVKTPGIILDKIQEDEIEGDQEKKRKGKIIYKKGRVTVRGKAGFSKLPEKDDSLDELMDKSEMKGDIDVEF